MYKGRVVNITKFGAFVNILPGRDGLVRISKLDAGKRINAVEDVLSLGQELEVRVDEIDDEGKVSLTPVGDEPEQGRAAGGDGAVRDRRQRERCRQRVVRGRIRRRAEPGGRRPRPQPGRNAGDGSLIVTQAYATAAGAAIGSHMRPAKALERPPCRSLFMN